MASDMLASVLRDIRHLGDGASDAELLRRFTAERDEAAFATLLWRHGPLVLGACRQVLRHEHDAEDAFQAAFLVLATKSGSIRQQQSLPAWLCRVAFNVATTARTVAARRRALERQVVQMTEASPEEAADRDWQPLVHEEVNRLPEKYRVPVVLCYLAGRTHEEAAGELGWPVGTVKGRLARARDLLRMRLSRRGFSQTAGSLVAGLSRVSVAVPSSLLTSIVKAVSLVAAGQAAAAGMISAKVAALTEGVLKTMLLTTLKIAVVVLLAVGVIAASVGGVAYRTMAGPGEATSRSDGDAPAVPRGKGESKEKAVVVEKDGVVFELVLPERSWSLPENKPGRTTLVEFGLRITNKTNTPRRFGGFLTLVPEIVDGDGKPLELKVGEWLRPPRITEADFPLVLPGKRVTFLTGARLSWRDGAPRFGADAPGPDKYAAFWYFLGLKLGRYKVRIVYESKQESAVVAPDNQVLKDIWTGRIATPFVEVALREAERNDPPAPADKPAAKGAFLAASKTVRVNDADFQAVVEPQRPAPPPGGEQPINLGFRITNPSNKALWFDLNRIEPALKSADGKVFEQRAVRKRTAYVAPIVLGPAESRNVLWRGHLESPKDTDSFRLRYIDGTMGGALFEGLHLGKYRLCFHYETTEQAANTVIAFVGPPAKREAIWLGKAITEEVEFEIVPAAKAGVEEPRRMDLLLAELESADGGTRLTATKDVFARGKAAVADLEKAGAKPIAPIGTINPRRVDVIYSLLKGLPPNPPAARAGYKTDSFGLHLDTLGTEEDVARMGKQLGFSLTGTFRKDGRPNCYVTLEKGKSLAEVMQAVLTSERKIVTVSLNYFEE